MSLVVKIYLFKFFKFLKMYIVINSKKYTGIPVAVVLFAAMALALSESFGTEKMPSDGSLVTTQQISDQIFGPYLLPFWALSFVLLAAVIGAIVLARKD